MLPNTTDDTNTTQALASSTRLKTHRIFCCEGVEGREREGGGGGGAPRGMVAVGGGRLGPDPPDLLPPGGGKGRLDDPPKHRERLISTAHMG